MSIKDFFSESNSIWIDFIVFSLGEAAYGMMEIVLDCFKIKLTT